MSSLKESVRSNRWWAFEDWDDWAEGYIKELEQHMTELVVTDIEGAQLSGYTIAVQRMLAFLRGSTHRTEL